jgi:hypothetical protein
MVSRANEEVGEFMNEDLELAWGMSVNSIYGRIKPAAA